MGLNNGFLLTAKFYLLFNSKQCLRFTLRPLKIAEIVRKASSWKYIVPCSWERESAPRKSFWSATGLVRDCLRELEFGFRSVSQYGSSTKMAANKEVWAHRWHRSLMKDSWHFCSHAKSKTNFLRFSASPSLAQVVRGINSKLWWKHRSFPQLLYLALQSTG